MTIYLMMRRVLGCFAKCDTCKGLGRLVDKPDAPATERGYAVCPSGCSFGSLWNIFNGRKRDAYSAVETLIVIAILAILFAVGSKAYQTYNQPTQQFIGKINSTRISETYDDEGDKRTNYYLTIDGLEYSTSSAVYQVAREGRQFKFEAKGTYIKDLFPFDPKRPAFKPEVEK